jgi:DNA-directed RNA polymerase I, II, and III subunit RPABC5
MIIPVKCFTCGKVIAHKYQLYLDKVASMKKDGSRDINYLDTSNIEKTPEGKVLDELGFTDICCRRHMLTHVDIL